MKHLLSIMILLLLWDTSVHGQKNDYIWCFGYGTDTPPENSMWGRSIMNFHHLGRQDFLQFDGYGIIDFQVGDKPRT